MRIDPAGKLLLGLGTGIAFGALLQRSRASRFDAILAQLRLRDGSIARLMGTAIAVGALGVHALVRAGKAKLDIKPLQLGGIVGGGALFGVGLAVLGYCPGTTMAAIGEGRRDAMAGALGMLGGAGLFVRAYPAIEPLIKAGDHGKTTLPRVGTSPWPWVSGLGAAVAASALLGNPAKTRFLR